MDCLRLFRIFSISVDSDNNLYVADSFNYRIQKFDPTGSPMNTFGSAGTGPGQFGSNTRVTVDLSDDSVFVSDINNNRIQKFDSTGVLDESFETSFYA